MYYFLGLVTKTDLVKGIIRPTYVLAVRNSETQNYAPWQVVKIGKIMESSKRVLTTSLVDNDMMIDFMSNYRTRPVTEYGNYIKKYPEGALFWFSCDRRGNPIGKAIYIKNVPDTKGRKTDDKWQYMKKELLRYKYLNELFVKDARFYPDVFTHKKPRAIQSSWYGIHHEEELNRFIKERSLYAKRSKRQRSKSDNGNESEECDER